MNKRLRSEQEIISLLANLGKTAEEVANSLYQSELLAGKRTTRREGDCDPLGFHMLLLDIQEGIDFYEMIPGSDNDFSYTLWGGDIGEGLEFRERDLPELKGVFDFMRADNQGEFVSFWPYVHDAICPCSVCKILEHYGKHYSDRKPPEG